MMKRSVLPSLAAALIASVAFSAPSQAGSTTVTTMGVFSLGPPSAKASEWTFDYVDSADKPLTGMSGLSIMSTGGLTILTDTIVSPGMIDITFSPANHTTGTPFPLTPGLEFSFATTHAPDDVFLAGWHLKSSGATGGVNVAMIASIPEPSSPSGRVHLEGGVKTGDHSRDGAEIPVQEMTLCLGATSSTSAGAPSSTSSAAAA
jgi:hypothetical protein